MSRARATPYTGWILDIAASATVFRRPHPDALRLAAFYAAFFIVIGVIQPFWPLWLASRQLNAAEIGIVLAIGIGAKVIGLPIAAPRRLQRAAAAADAAAGAAQRPELCAVRTH